MESETTVGGSASGSDELVLLTVNPFGGDTAFRREFGENDSPEYTACSIVEALNALRAKPVRVVECGLLVKHPKDWTEVFRFLSSSMFCPMYIFAADSKNSLVWASVLSESSWGRLIAPDDVEDLLAIMCSIGQDLREEVPAHD